MQADPLAFLDEFKESDPLSFLETQAGNRPVSISNSTVDPLAFLDQSDESFFDKYIQPIAEKFVPKPYGQEVTAQPERSPRQKILDIYRSEEKTPEELQAMTVEERMQYVQDLQNLRELQQATGFGKGALSGLTLSASEHIPGLKPDENDLMVGLGETIGSYLPISRLYTLIGKPLVQFAAKSPVARQGLMALARMTGFGLTGATYEAGKEIVQGEIPAVEELAKEGATWAAIDAALQSVGLGVAFNSAVRNIAGTEGVPVKEILSRLWNSTKNFLKQKFIPPENIGESEIEVLMQEVKRAEAQVKPRETEIEVAPEAKPEQQIGSELTQTKNELEKESPDRSKKTYELTYDEVERELKKVHDFERKIIEPKVGEDAYEQYEKSSFEAQRNFWDKYTDRFTKDEINLIENYPYSPEELRSRLNDIRSIRTAYNIGETPQESINNVIGDIRKQLILYRDPANKALVKEAFKYLTDKGHTKEEIAKETNKVLRRDLSRSDAQYVLDSLFKPSEMKPEKPIGVLEASTPKKQEEILKSIPPEALEELPKKPTQIPPKQTRPKQPVIGKKQAVARSKILKLFREAFTDPIRLGKISQRNAAGIHKLWPKVTRLLKDNDIETAAHEIGHNLHTTLYGGDAKTPQEQVKNINASLRPYLKELKPLAHYEPFGMEGFAEFTRLYVTNPEVARELATNFYAKFEADLEAQYPELKNALLEARDYYDRYLQGTPQSRIRAQTSYASDNGKLQNIIDSIKKKLHPDVLKTQFLDDVFPAKRLVAEAFGIPLSEVENLKDPANLYRSLRVLKGAVGKADVFVLHETFNAKTLKKVGRSLRDILKKLPDEESYREFNDYLIARRSIEKHAQAIETGINLGDAVAVESQLRAKYSNLAKELDQYNDALLNYAKDSGLISEKQHQLVKQNNLMYAPFQRVMELDKGGVAAGGGKLQAGKPIKKMKGSTRDIIAPIESVLKNTYSIIVNAEKNLSGQVLAKIAKIKNMGAYVEAVPTPIKLKGKVEGEQIANKLARSFLEMGLDDLIEFDSNGKPVLREDIASAIPEVFLRFGAGQYPAGENIVTVFFEGKPQYYEVSPEIYEMWTKGIAPYTANLLTKILRIPARTLRAGAILNPKFIQKNFIRDTWGSWLFTKYGKSVKDPVGLFIDTLYSPLAMMATSVGNGGLYVEWMKSGGSMSTMQSLDRDHVIKKLDEVRHGVKPHQVIKWLRTAAEISEEANRLSEFGKALNVEQKSRLGAEIAAFASRDLSIDFSRMGLQAKALNQIIPFWNATIQGGDKLLRTLLNPEDRKNFLPRVLGFIVIPSLILAWLNKDDDRVKEFYEEEKDFNFITFVGDQAVKIPVPFEIGVLAHGLTQRMFNYFINKDPEAFEKFMGSIADAMLPNAIPAFANPFIESWANKNFFTGARIVPLEKEGLVAKYQYKHGTSATARLLGRAMAYMLGQETRSKAASPAIIDHFINSWGGGLGRLMISISDASLEAAGLSDKIPGQAITEKLGLDAFTARYPRASTRSIEKFYDSYADATSKQKSLKFAEKMSLETEEEREASYKRFEKIYDYNTLRIAYKSIQSCQREINNIWNDPSVDPNLKKQMIDDLYLQMIEFAKAANEDIQQHRLI